MGFLDDTSETLAWQETSQWSRAIRRAGVRQFINLFKKSQPQLQTQNSTSQQDGFVWGDEIEYIIVERDQGKTILSCTSETFIEVLNTQSELEAKTFPGKNASKWHPEYARYMLEGVPLMPYGFELYDLMGVECNMRSRRTLVNRICAPLKVLTVASFPILGASEAFEKKIFEESENNDISMSAYTPDAAISLHPRFKTLTRNIRERRGRKVDIRIPIFTNSKQAPLNIQSTLSDSLQNSNTFIESESNSFANKYHHQVKSKYDEPETKSMGSLLSLNSETEANVKSNSKMDSKTPLTNNALDGNSTEQSIPFPRLYNNNALNIPSSCIDMDSMCFGMGCSCLQLTVQASSIHEARLIYDRLVVLAPLMMAISAASPIFKGKLADTDCRWNVVSQSVDDRTFEEMSTIRKSRYGTVSRYLQNIPSVQALNDLPEELDCESLETLMAAGIDDVLAKHIAYLFIRDPLVVYSSDLRELSLFKDESYLKLGLDRSQNQNHHDHSHKYTTDTHDGDTITSALLSSIDSKTSHFDSLQSTNWHTVRFKPSTPKPFLGWRVEFRSMEVQLTDFGNAALVIFVILLIRAWIEESKKQNSSEFDETQFLIPISMCDENMERAHQRDAITSTLFYFKDSTTGEIRELTLQEIIIDNLSKTIKNYLKGLHLERQLADKLQAYIRYVEHRAQGIEPTNAQWIRNFVLQHPEYQQHVSTVNVGANICHDLIGAILELD